MSVLRRTLLGIALISLGGCVATTYTMVAPGTVMVEALQVTPGEAWNQVPPMLSPSSRRTTRVWTRDGLLLDRLVIIPGVPDGEPIVESDRKDAALPVFRAGMLPNEIEELTESTIVKLFGEGGVSVSTSNLRPHRFDDHRGILFNFEVAVSDGPDYKGLVGSFIVGKTLYMLMYFGAEPFYYQKHLPEAEAIITSARLVGKS